MAAARRRVLLVSNLLPPQVEGGAERVAWRELCGLARRGHAVRGLAPLWGGRAPYAPPSCDTAGPEVVRVPTPSRAARRPGREFAPQPALTRAFDSLLADFRPEVVHFHNLNGVSLGLPARAGAAGVPRVATFHDGWGVCPKSILLRPGGQRCGGAESLACVPCLEAGRSRRHSLRRRALLVARNARVRRALRGLERLLFPSRHHLELYARAGYPRDRCRWLPNPTPELAPEVERAARAEPARTGPLRLLYLGGLAPHKGLDVLLAALARLPDGTARLAIHGRAAPDERARLEARLAARGLAACVRHGGELAPEYVPAAIAACDAVVVPSLCVENSPLAILEAQAVGRPVLASRVGGIGELVRDGDTGYGHPPGDVEALARDVARLAASEDERARLGERARASVAGRDLAAHLDALEAIYAEATAEARGAGAGHGRAASAR